MGPLAAGLVVLVRFPFSDLSSSKIRPALALFHAGGPDWVLSQITSNPYRDDAATRLTDESFRSGGLTRESYVRTAKLFTASTDLVTASAGQLRPEVLDEVVETLIRLLRSGSS